MSKVSGIKGETKRLILRPMQMRDDRAWAAAHAAMLPTKGSWEVPRLPLSKVSYPHYAKFLARNQQEMAKGERYNLGIFHKETGTLLGFLFIENIDRENSSSAVIDFRIFNIYWGKGFAKEALNEGMKLKSRLKLDKLELSKKSAAKVKL